MMNARSIPMAIAVMLLMIIALPSAEAGTAFLDDFEDGDYADNNPVTWSRYPAPYDLGTVEITDGDLVVTPSTDYPRYPGMGSYFETDLVVEDHLFHDVNVLTRFRASRSGSVTGFGLLDTYYTDALEGAALWGFLNHPLGDVRITLQQNTTLTNLSFKSVPLSPVNDDINLRFVIDGEYATLTAWADGQDEPDPQLRTRLPLALRGQDHQGRVTLFTGSSAPPVPVAFRFVEVVPEPSSALLAALGLLGLALSNRRVSK